MAKTKVLIYDLTILGVMIGQAIANDADVRYFSPWESPFPKWHNQTVGFGIPGITRVDSYEDQKAELLADDGIFIFPDVGSGDKQKDLRNLGARVFGAGDSGELEFNRSLFKNTLKQVGLPVPKYGIIKGTDALGGLLQKEKDLWIKLDVENRGIMETRYHKDWATSQEWYYKLVNDLGCTRSITNFMWEKPIPGVEIGQDNMLANGVSFKELLYGWELKGDAYLCQHMTGDELPAPLRRINKAMAPIEKKYGTCGAVSSEVRYGEEREPVFIDPARRFGNPPCASIVANYKNLFKVLEGVADGVEVPPEWNAKYAGEISVEVTDADTMCIPMALKEKDLDRIKLRCACRIDDMFWNIPFKEVGCTVVKAVGLGKTKEEAGYNALEAAEDFSGKCKGAFFNRNAFEELEEEFEKGAKLGVPFE